jgi:hypothetical protein
MRDAWASLKRVQKVVLVALLVGDVALLATGGLIVRGAAPAPAPVPALAPDCQAVSARLLAQRNLAGAARLDADGGLRFELSGQDAAGRLLPRASEMAWDALAAAALLPHSGCGPYSSLRVDIPDPGGQPGARLLVQVNWIDLRAWGKGELDDGELAARVQALNYFHPEPVQP